MKRLHERYSEGMQTKRIKGSRKSRSFQHCRVIQEVVDDWILDNSRKKWTPFLFVIS